ncbi:hypothetical protein PTKIN_Ptkin16aG0049100 [Pterospermum kingtungense]
MEAISEVFPVDKRGSEKGNDLGWACVLILESLIPVVVDPVIGKSRMLVTPSMKEKAKEIADTWKRSLEERGGIDNFRTPDVHTFLQHLVTFGIVKKEDLELYRKLVVASAWRKQMPKLAVSLGLGDRMPVVNPISGSGGTPGPGPGELGSGCYKWYQSDLATVSALVDRRRGAPRAPPSKGRFWD